MQAADLIERKKKNPAGIQPTREKFGARGGEQVTLNPHTDFHPGTLYPLNMTTPYHKAIHMRHTKICKLQSSSKEKCCPERNPLW